MTSPITQIIPEIGSRFIDNWFVKSASNHESVLRITLERSDGDQVVWRLQRAETPGPRSPFDTSGWQIAYENTSVAYDQLIPCGQAWMNLVQLHGSTLSSAWTTTTNDTWQTRIQAELLDQPQRSVRLGDLLRPEELPKFACTLPWTRLEASQGGFIGPCCLEYQRGRWPNDDSPAALWNGPALQAFRRTLANHQAPMATCRPTCPVLLAGNERAENVRIYGGSAASLQAQVRSIESLLRGDSIVSGWPSQVCLTVTSYCNYDCLMCPHGEEGRIDDQLTPSFYAGLTQMLEGVCILELNGGEPLASPYLRGFLEEIDSNQYSHLRINLITNGSYLSEKQLERFEKVPWGNLTFSLNAATAATYKLVNRGLEFSRIQAHLEAVHAVRRQVAHRANVTYSMVLLLANFHEIEAFFDLAQRDGADVRYLLPFRDRHGSSLMTQRVAMETAQLALERVADRLERQNRMRQSRDVRANAQILAQRIQAGVFQAL